MRRKKKIAVDITTKYVNRNAFGRLENEFDFYSRNQMGGNLNRIYGIEG